MAMDLKTKIKHATRYKLVRDDNEVFPWSEAGASNPRMKVVPIDFDTTTLNVLDDAPVTAILPDAAPVEPEEIAASAPEAASTVDDWPGITALTTKDEAQAYAKQMFGVELDGRKSLAAMKEAIIKLFEEPVG